jgi:hypothetical protein
MPPAFPLPGLAPGTGGARRLFIAQRAPLVVPSNSGRKLPTGRRCHPSRFASSLPFAPAQRIVASLPAAAYPSGVSPLETD